jgi:DNA-binding NarL/FixJ family response regulator
VCFVEDLIGKPSATFHNVGVTAPNLASPALSGLKRVLIVDDHVAVVEMIAQVIDSMPDYRVIGSAIDAESAIKLAEQEKPDIIVLDLVLQRSSGLTVMSELRARLPRTRFLIFSGNLRVPAVRQALASGVLGMIDKGSRLAEFRLALEQVAAGQPHFAGEAGTLIRQLVQHRGGERSPVVDLSPREQTVLRHLAEGLSSREIAERLGLSIHTVVNHRSNLMRKTGLHRVAQLSLYAAEIGLVAPDTTKTS